MRKARTRGGSAGLPRARIAWREVLEPRQTHILSNFQPEISYQNSQTYPIYISVSQGAAQGPAGVAIESARSKLLASAAYLKAEEARLHSHVLSAAAGAAVAFGALPPKLNHLIQPLVRSIRGETDPLLQRRSARALACLIKLANARTPSPVPKIVQNLSLIHI